MKAVRQIFFTTLILLVIPLVSGAVLVTTWLADRDKPLTVIKVWAEPTEVKPCSSVQLWVDRIADRDTGVNLEFLFTDSKNQSAPPIVYSTKQLRGPLGRYAYSTAIPVPCEFKPGWAVLERRVDYWRNPLQQYLWPIPGHSRKVPVCITTDGVGSAEVCKRPYLPPLD